MASLSLSLAIRPCFVNGGIEESCKVSSAVHCFFGNKLSMQKRFLWGNFGPDIKGTSGRYVGLKVLAGSRVSTQETEQIITTGAGPDVREKALSYLFRTENGGQVKVVVSKKSTKYAVYIDVSSFHMPSSYDRLVLSWGIYRSDSSQFIDMELQNSDSDNEDGTSESPFIQTSFGSFSTELEFEVKEIPFYLSFYLKTALGTSHDGSIIGSHRKTNFCVPVGFGSGHPFPLGLSFLNDGSMNFAYFSRDSDSVVLCLYNDSTTEKPALELELDPYVNRSGDIWHASLESAWNYVSYGYKCKGPLFQERNSKTVIEPVLLDPYAKIVGNSFVNTCGSISPVKYLGRLCKEPAFDWDGDVPPNLPAEELVVYRLNVNRFTGHKSSQLPSGVAGTFSGLTDKLSHLIDLGVNAVLLEPIFPFDKDQGPYFPCHFFSPTNTYGPSNGPISAINTMKEMVKNLHDNKIEVLLEVAFTHTADAGALQGIDDESYYYDSRVDDSENKNALNCNYPVVQQLILDSLRHLVSDFHIDGFCFINASNLLRGFHGEYLSRPPLIEAIAFDPVLSNTKIIADCWDPHDLIVKETHFPHWKRWGELNAKFCTDIRVFLRGEGLLSSLATRICGSGDIFSDGRGPAFSFNFISRNSGLTLVDLVSFSSNELPSESSWNCGEEGPTNDRAVLERRLKQIRNFLFILFVSLGVPVLNMGDECGQSCGGSMAYNERKHFDWTALTTGFGQQIIQFISFLSSFRMKRNDLLQRKNFLKEENIDWFGNDQSPPRWDDPSSKFLAVQLKADKLENQLSLESSHTRGDLFIAFNAAEESEIVVLPPPPKGMEWRRLVDTALPFPGFFSDEGKPILEQEDGLYTYKMKSHSCALFEARCHGV